RPTHIGLRRPLSRTDDDVTGGGPAHRSKPRARTGPRGAQTTGAPHHRWGGAGLRGAGAGPGTGRSAAQTQAGDERAVALDVDLLQVLEHPATLADQEQQSATRVVVVLVLLEVLREILDPT